MFAKFNFFIKKYLTKAPYQGPFIAGLLAAFAGALIWLAARYGWISFYPRQSHANLMYFGFLWSFIAGFLMTAGPKMTQTKGPSSFEMKIPMIVVFLQIFINYFNLPHWGLFLGIGQQVFLFYFIGKRLWHRKSLPFEGFVFLLFAMMVSALGIALFLVNRITFSDFLVLIGEAFVLNLICGIGSRLIPIFSRIPLELDPITSNSKRNQWIMIGWATVLNLSYLLQVFHFVSLGHWIRFFFLLLFAHKYFKFFQKPALRSYLGWGVKVGIMMAIFGSLLPAIFPDYSLALQHLTLLGGLSTITLMIATRVTLAHGGESIDRELKEKVILAVSLSFGLSAVFRALAGAHFMGYAMLGAIVCFLMALVFWVFRFIKVLVR